MLVKALAVGLAVLFLLVILRRFGSKSTLGGPPSTRREGSQAKGASAGPAVAKSSFDALLRTVVLLEDNDWSACTVDGMKESWARYAEAPVRGFCTIPAGRHRVVTEVEGQPVTLDFVLHPEAIYVKRLDRAARAWVDPDAASRARAERQAVGGERGELSNLLVRYRSTMGIARTQSGEKLGSPTEALEAATRDLGAALDLADADQRLARAAAAGESLVGVPLLEEQLRALIVLVSTRIADAERAGDLERAAAIARAGLAALPEEPSLLAELRGLARPVDAQNQTSTV